MLSEERLTAEFIDLVNRYYPQAQPVLTCCHVKILECYVQRLGKQLFYLGIYYPEWVSEEIDVHVEGIKDIAENLGWAQVVFINASRLVRDPLSGLKRDNPRLWLELFWIVNHQNQP